MGHRRLRALVFCTNRRRRIVGRIVRLVRITLVRITLVRITGRRVVHPSYDLSLFPLQPRGDGVARAEALEG